MSALSTSCAVIQNLSVSFGNHAVLHDLSLSCPDHAITVLLGRSGSGKTTLLRSLNRLNEHFPGGHTSGSVSLRLSGAMTDIYGAQPPQVTELRRRAGMVFQSPNPLPVSIRRNVLLPVSLVMGLRGSAAEERLKNVLSQVGLWDEVSGRLDQPANQLSGGQQQRLCLARTLALEPDILLLDEPTASLDQKASAAIEELLRTLKQRYPVIMVSHSLVQALRLADSIVILREGRIVQTLSAQELSEFRNFCQSSGENPENALERML